MLPLCLIYVWKYGLDNEAVLTNLQGLFQKPMAQHLQQPHPPEGALAQQHQQ